MASATEIGVCGAPFTAAPRLSVQPRIGARALMPTEFPPEFPPFTSPPPSRWKEEVAMSSTAPCDSASQWASVLLTVTSCK